MQSEEEIIENANTFIGYNVLYGKVAFIEPVFKKYQETMQGLLDLYNIEKEKNRQSKMTIVQLENEISARIEDVNRDFISKDKIRKVINDLSYPIENDKRFIDTENLKIFFKKIKELLGE